MTALEFYILRLLTMQPTCRIPYPEFTILDLKGTQLIDEINKAKRLLRINKNMTIKFYRIGNKGYWEWRLPTL